MERNIVCCFLFLTVWHPVISQARILYEQRVWRDDVSLVRAVKGAKGVLKLREDSVVFIAENAYTPIINFSIPYSEIVKVKRYRAILWPNRIGMRTRSGGTYRLFTYKRKRIFEILDARSL